MGKSSEGGANVGATSDVLTKDWENLRRNSNHIVMHNNDGNCDVREREKQKGRKTKRH